MYNENPWAYRAPDDPPKGGAPPVDPPVDPPVAPVAPVAPEVDNSVIKGMRQQIAESKTALDTANEKLKEIERGDMKEVERLTDVNKELTGKLDKATEAQTNLDTANSALEAMYKGRIEAIPEEHRKSVEKLTATGDWPTRISAVDEAIKMLPKPQHAGKAANVTNADPAAVTPGPGQPTDPKPFDPKTVSETVKFREIPEAELKGKGGYADPNAITKADLTKAVAEAVAAAQKGA